MERIVHELAQGSDAWHQFRLGYHGASEAAPMLGLSKKVRRSELLHVKHTGIAKEFSDFVQANILDYGHEVEALARPIVEASINEELYPATMSYGNLSASCDGLTMDGEIAFEHKQPNQELVAAIDRGELPDEHRPQCQQILLVTGASKLIFVVSDGTADNFHSIEVLPDRAWQERIVAGWAQFDADLAEYKPPEVILAAVAAPTMALPALSIQVNGAITLTDNLAVFGSKLTAFIEGIDKNPSTDQAFADAEAAIKTLETAQNALEAAEAGALAQTASIDEMRRTVALYASQARTTRLMLEKLVKTRKEAIRVEIVQAAKNVLAGHVAMLNKRIGKNYMPLIAENLGGVIKGKKTVSSLQDAVDTEVARVKIELNAVADRISLNLATLRELAADRPMLFADAATIVLKQPDDLTALVKLRLSEHQQAEAKRIEQEREKIRIEEAAKAEVAARAKIEAEDKARRDQEETARQAQQSTQPATVAAQAASTREPLNMPQPAPKPKVSLTAHGPRPTDDQIVAVLASHFRVDAATARLWLEEMALSKVAA